LTAATASLRLLGIAVLGQIVSHGTPPFLLASIVVERPARIARELRPLAAMSESDATVADAA
jgi:hypothetical protein